MPLLRAVISASQHPRCWTEMTALSPTLCPSAPIPVVYSGEQGRYSGFIQFAACGAPHQMLWKSNSKWNRFLGSALKARTRAGNNSGHSYTGLCPPEIRSWKPGTLHISLIDFFQTPVVIKTEVHDFEKIRFWSSSQNGEINASDQQKWQITLHRTQSLNN